MTNKCFLLNPTSLWYICCTSLKSQLFYKESLTPKPDQMPLSPVLSMSETLKSEISSSVFWLISWVKLWPAWSQRWHLFSCVSTAPTHCPVHNSTDTLWMHTRVNDDLPKRSKGSELLEGIPKDFTKEEMFPWLALPLSPSLSPVWQLQFPGSSRRATANTLGWG